MLKPAEQAPIVAQKVVAALDEAGLLAGVINLVTGGGETVGDELVTNDRVDAISFTGSAAVGIEVYQTATAGGKRTQCEMGGKNPTVVMPSADLDMATRAVASGAFGGTGQACTACSHAIVHTDVHDEFFGRIVDHAEYIEIGPGLEAPDIGPQVVESERDSTLDYIEVGQTEGAILETGGGVPEDDRLSKGYFTEPMVFSGVESTMRIAHEGTFGPVLAVIEVDGFDEAIDVANDIDYGLSGSIITEDHGEANQFVDRGRRSKGKPENDGTGTPRAIRRLQAVLQRDLVRTGPRRSSVLHHLEDSVRRLLETGFRP